MDGALVDEDAATPLIRACQRKSDAVNLRRAVETLQLTPSSTAAALMNMAALVRKAKHLVSISRALLRRVPEDDWTLVAETIQKVLQRRGSPRERDAAVALRFLVLERLRPDEFEAWFERGTPRLAWDIWLCAKDRILDVADVAARVPKAKLLSRDGPWVWARDRPYMHKRDKRFSRTANRSFL